MPGVPPDAVDNVKKGLKSLFHRRHREGSGSGNDLAALAVPAQGSSSAPVEAPETTSMKTPKLTTHIPGASLGPETHNAGTSVDAENDDATAAAASGAPLNKTGAFAEGMSATSGPLGTSLQEVEAFEKLVERRSSAKTEDAAAAIAAVEKLGGEEAAATATDNVDQARTGTGEAEQAAQKSAGEAHEHTPGEGGKIDAPNRAEEQV